MRGVLNFPSVTGHRSTGKATTTAGSSIRGGVQAREGETGMDGYRKEKEGDAAKRNCKRLPWTCFKRHTACFDLIFAHDLLYSPAPSYVEAAVRSIGSYSTRRLSMCTSIFNG